MGCTARTFLIASTIVALLLGISAARAEAVRHDVLLTVTSSLRGASVEATHAGVSEPVENSLRDLAGLQVIVTISRAGESTLFVKLWTPEGTDAALAAARTSLAAVKPLLPPAVEGPRIAIPDARATPVAYMTLASMTAANSARTALELSTIGRRHLATALKTIPHVAAVKEHGLRSDMVVAALDPARLAAYGLTRAGVEDLLRQHAGFSIEAVGPNELAIYEAHAVLPDTETLSQVVLKVISGVPVRLRDVAQIERRMRPPEDYVTVNGRTAFLVEIYMSERMTLAEATPQFRDSVPTAMQSLPAGLDIRIIYSCAACAERRR